MGKYHCTVELLFDWFGISCMTTDNFCFYLWNRLIQTSQIGGQWYIDPSPFSIPCTDRHFLNLKLCSGFEPLVLVCQWVYNNIYEHSKTRGKYHCIVDLLFDLFLLVCFANENKNCQLSYRWFQTRQTGGQQFSDTSPFSVPCRNIYNL